MDRDFAWQDAPGPAVLRMPEGEVLAGLVALHGARDGRARQALFDQLGQALTPLGIAVLTYERRAVEDGETPLHLQAADAVAAARALRSHLRRGVGIFGFSQGAWAATLAAANDPADFLVVLGCSGVSPAEQMRFYTDELLRRLGFGPEERAENLRLRLHLEEYLREPDRGNSDREALATALHAASGKPWFPRSYLPPAPPPDEARWEDMDFDPAASFAKVRGPVLAMWGDDEECVPRELSSKAWQSSGADVTLLDLPGCGHWPVMGSGAPDYSGWEDDELAQDFIATMTGWISNEVTRPSGRAS